MGPRTVVFRVSGIITLESPLRITNPFLTIAGQTAPGDGICVRNQTVEINTHDVIVRYLRFRRGNLKDRNDAVGGYPVRNIIIDHVSASWGLDENLSLYRYMLKTPGGREQKMPVENLTIQWSISSEALNPNNHAFGATWGGRDSSFHHNLFACNTGRNPSIGMGGLFDFRNNVLFNWRHRTIDGGDGSSQVNLINNYFKPGPVTPEGPLQHRICKLEARPPSDRYPGAGQWYVAGNHVAGSAKITEDNWAGGVQKEGAVTLESARAKAPFPAPPVTLHSAEEAFELVLANAGATLPKRDPVDTRIVESVRSGKPSFKAGIIDDPADVGGWPEYRSLPPPSDKDHDGMPDAWEQKYGLDPDDPSDAAQDKDKDGYTNLEEHLNGTDPTEFVDYTKAENNQNGFQQAVKRSEPK
jgi:hypothetical protein